MLYKWCRKTSWLLSTLSVCYSLGAWTWCNLFNFFFLQISALDGFFFKAFKGVIEKNLRKERPADRHVRFVKVKFVSNV